MTLKELKTRFIRGLIYWPLFLLPVKKQEKPVAKDALIYKVSNVKRVGIYCTLNMNSTISYRLQSMPNPKKITNIFEYKGAYQTNQLPTGFPADFTILYNLRDKNGTLVNKKTYPQLFHDKLYNECVTLNGDMLYISENLVKNRIEDQPSDIFIEWGDDSSSIFKYSISSSPTLIIQGTELIYDVYSIENFGNFYHNYAEVDQNKEYTISITGSVLSINLGMAIPVNSNSDIHISILNWGNLGIRMLNNCFGFANYGKTTLDYIAEPAYFDEVLIMNNSFYCGSNLLISNTIDMTAFVKKVMSASSKAIMAYYVFAQLKEINYVPEKLCEHNKSLISIENIFDNCINIKYVGNGAFSNLPDLICADHCVNYANSLEYIADDIFSNDTKLVTASAAFAMPSGGFFYKIGARVFKNCSSLIIHPFFNTFFHDRPLQIVGEELFSGCKSLMNISYLFDQTYDLEEVGKDIFKGCKSLRNIENVLCTYSPFLKSIPENLFADIECSEYDPDNSLSFNFQCQHNYAFKSIFNYTGSEIPTKNTRGHATHEEYKGEYRVEYTGTGRVSNFMQQYISHDLSKTTLTHYNPMTKKYEWMINSNIQNYICTVGSNFLPTKFIAQGGKIAFQTDFDYPIIGVSYDGFNFDDATVSGAIISNYCTPENEHREYYFLYDGFAPEYWTIPDSEVYESTRYFGVEKGNADGSYHINVYGSSYEYTSLPIAVHAHGEQYFSNYEAIPKNKPYLEPIEEIANRADNP